MYANFQISDVSFVFIKENSNKNNTKKAEPWDLESIFSVKEENIIKNTKHIFNTSLSLLAFLY